VWKHCALYEVIVDGILAEGLLLTIVTDGAAEPVSASRPGSVVWVSLPPVVSSGESCRGNPGVVPDDTEISECLKGCDTAWESSVNECSNST
jgi:hypothetical protein